MPRARSSTCSHGRPNKDCNHNVIPGHGNKARIVAHLERDAEGGNFGASTLFIGITSASPRPGRKRAVHGIAMSHRVSSRGSSSEICPQGPKIHSCPAYSMMHAISGKSRNEKPQIKVGIVSSQFFQFAQNFFEYGTAWITVCQQEDNLREGLFCRDCYQAR